jgi:hypothetical protein
LLGAAPSVKAICFHAGVVLLRMIGKLFTAPQAEPPDLPASIRLATGDDPHASKSLAPLGVSDVALGGMGNAAIGGPRRLARDGGGGPKEVVPRGKKQEHSSGTVLPVVPLIHVNGYDSFDKQPLCTSRALGLKSASW